MKKSYCIILLIIIVIISCKEQEISNNIPDNAIILEVEDTCQVDSLVLSPLKLLFHKNKIIVYDAVRNGSYLKFIVFNDNMKYLYSFGEKGKAANEFGNIFSNNIFSSDYVEALDFGDMSMKYIDFQEDCAKISKKKIIPNAVDGAPINSIRKINDGLYFSNCSANISNEYEIIKFSVDTNGQLGKTSPLSKIPKWYTGDLNQRFTYLAYNNYNELRSHDKIGIFYYNYPYFRIIDTDGNLILENEMLVNNKSILAEEKAYFYNVYATDKYIYSIWCNYSTNSTDDFKYNKIVAIDWNGNIKALYELNANASSEFVVSDNDEFLYNISNDEENPSLVKYKIPI